MREKADALFNGRGRRLPVLNLCRRPDSTTQRALRSIDFAFSNALDFGIFCFRAGAPGAVNHFWQNVLECIRMTDKGDAAVSIDNERLWNMKEGLASSQYLSISPE
ncbi:hypothetical protein [Rhizobium indigoferae]|uniref:Uncharacterized protein n=1 Tax=Rhizobium indigoferae TaxID=158891 RepID=A0ABZ1DMM1_9HYPH|nr:hypothetical protein [Rhizobium indigoferae]WRW37495.1 hypothetical protein U5G49_007069 [Rhizobium indigoferae]